MNYGATTELRKIAPVSFSYGATRTSGEPALKIRGVPSGSQRKRKGAG